MVTKPDMAPNEFAKSQEYVATVTTFIGDDPEVFYPLAHALIEERAEREKEVQSA